VHAELVSIGGEWTLVDDGISRNGTFVNGERVVGRRRLQREDRIRAGLTLLAYHGASRSDETRTITANAFAESELSAAQRRVLVCLCRPYLAGSRAAAPATNQQIARDLYVSVETVKAHLKSMFGKFGLNELPQNAKRAGLAEHALRHGLVTRNDA
jgi:hypothetical protein